MDVKRINNETTCSLYKDDVPQTKWIFKKHTSKVFEEVITANDTRRSVDEFFRLKIEAVLCGKDAGEYRCISEGEVRSTIHLDCSHSEPQVTIFTDAIKDEDLYHINAYLLEDHNLKLYSKFHKTSKCSRCKSGTVGFTKKVGHCYLAKINAEMPTRPHNKHFDTYREIPCRSRLLDHNIHDISAIKNRKSVFAYRFCKNACPATEIVNITDKSGRLVDKVDRAKGERSFFERIEPPRNFKGGRHFVIARRLDSLAVNCTRYLFKF